VKGVQKFGFFCFLEIILNTLRRPCLMGLGVRMDKTLEKLGAPLQKFPMDDTSPSPYTLVLLD